MTVIAFMAQGLLSDPRLGISLLFIDTTATVLSELSIGGAEHG